MADAIILASNALLVSIVMINARLDLDRDLLLAFEDQVRSLKTQLDFLGNFLGDSEWKRDPLKQLGHDIRKVAGEAKVDINNYGKYNRKWFPVFSLWFLMFGLWFPMFSEWFLMWFRMFSKWFPTFRKGTTLRGVSHGLNKLENTFIDICDDYEKYKIHCQTSTKESD